MKRHPQAGFTLIELMITVAIIGLLAAIGIPQYSDYVTRGKVTEATTNLANMRVRMEQYYQDNRRYNTTATSTDCGVTTPSGSDVKNFTYECAITNSGQGFTITARGAATQGMDSFVYMINEAGARTSQVPAKWETTPPTVTFSCWVTRKGGAC